MHRLVGVLGLLTMMGLAYLFSTNRRAIRGKTVAWGLGLQIVFAFFVINWTVRSVDFPEGRRGRELGPRFRLLTAPSSSSASWEKKSRSIGFFFAFQVLPTIIFIAAFFALLYYYGVMQFIVKQAARVMTRLMGASGAESLNVAASIFMGQTEAPLTIRPYPARSHSIRIDDHHDQRHGPRFRRDDGRVHCLRHRSQASARRRDHDRPGTILLAKMLVPETETPRHRRQEWKWPIWKRMPTRSARWRAAPSTA